VKEFPDSIQKIIDYLMQLPGIGPRSAFRIVSHLLSMQDESLDDFGKSLSKLKKEIGFCKTCFNISEGDLCVICENESRDKYSILVVEDILDLVAFERVGEYKGLYHVIGGVISPLRGIGPEDLHIKELFVRAKDKEVKEIIIATNPNLEGEATAMYIKNELIKSPQIKVTRIARGIPTGADIDYADDATLSQALIRRADY
jgi:recombination protein RecR